MPLRIWRTDEVTPRQPHPNDPPSPPRRSPGAREYFVHFAVKDSRGGPDFDNARTAEATASREAAEQGLLVRLWRLPGEGRALGLGQSTDPVKLDKVLSALPLVPWLDVEVTPLDPHPSDPGGTA